MKVKFISSTNSASAFEELQGKDGELSYSMTARFTFDNSDVSFDLRHGYFSTSYIKNIKIEEISFNCFLITIDTNNSQYVFQNGEFSDRKPFTNKEKLDISLAFGLF